MSLNLPEVSGDIVNTPRVQRAFEDFIIEALDEAMDMLATGDTSTRIALVKTVLSMAMKAKGENGNAEAEQILAQARQVVNGLIDNEE